MYVYTKGMAASVASTGSISPLLTILKFCETNRQACFSNRDKYLESQETMKHLLLCMYKVLCADRKRYNYAVCKV